MENIEKVGDDIKPEDGVKIKDTADERGRSEGVLNEVGCSGKLMCIFVEKILEKHSGEAGSLDDGVRGKLKVAEKEKVARGSDGQRGGNGEEDGSGIDGEGRNASDEDWKDDVAREGEGKIDTGVVTMGVVEEEN